MNEPPRDRLYNLLPAVLRLRDDEQDELLRTLMAILESEYQLVQDGIAQLYDNWFIETCTDDFIPYIGDLVGNRPLHDIHQVGRKDVAKTIYYRRRKGTLAVLEELARDVTGWYAHAVEFFQLLGWTQHLNHQRFTMAANPDATYPNALDRVGTVNLRSTQTLDWLHGPFDIGTHTVDVRDITQQHGWYNIRNVGIFLWRLFEYPLEDIQPRPATGITHGFHMQPISNPAPIFHKPHPEDDAAALAEEKHIGAPISPVAFSTDIEAYRRTYASVPPEQRAPNSSFYGPARGFMIYRDNQPVTPMQMMCKNLDNWERPPAGRVAVDVRLGRITFAVGEEPDNNLRVNTTYGFSGDMGGGPYDRRESLTAAGYVLTVERDGSLISLQQAIAQWEADGKPDGLIRIADNDNYDGGFVVDLPARGWLAIEAENGKRPTITIPDTAQFNAPEEGATLILNGLLMRGRISVEGNIDLHMRHCTIVPGSTLSPDGTPVNPDHDSIHEVNGPFNALSLSIDKSILGAIRLSTFSQRLIVRDSIVVAADPAQPAIAANNAGTQPAPVSTIERSTIFGTSYLRELAYASCVIFVAPVTVDRRQTGCVRFSYVSPGSRVPDRYRCQPDIALGAAARSAGLETIENLPVAEVDRILARVKPEFTAERFGDPAFMQLSLACANEIKTGAENGAEMGAFNFLMQPQRLANLHRRLEEYLAFGRVAGTIYVT
jgi:hypothetical protein